MSRRPRHPSGEELKLWSEVAKTVAPIGPRPVMAAAKPKAEAKPPKSQRASAAAKPVAPVHPKPMPPPKPAAFDRRMRSRIGKGLLPLDARIDLHGMTQAAAHLRLVAFIRKAQANGAKLVLVITGKGRAAVPDGIHEERGVLRRAVPHWLGSSELRGLVVGFDAAGPGHGGDGALYVRLRRKERQG